MCSSVEKPMPVQFVGFVPGKIRKAEYRIREVVTQRVKLQVYEKCPTIDGVQFNPPFFVQWILSVSQNWWTSS